MILPKRAGRDVARLDTLHSDFNKGLDHAETACGIGAAYTGAHVVGTACSLTKSGVDYIDNRTSEGRGVANREFVKDLVSLEAANVVGGQVPQLGKGTWIAEYLVEELVERAFKKPSLT